MLNNSDGLRRGPFGSALKKAFFVKESSFVVYEQQNAIYDRFNTRYRISEKKFAELHNFEVLPGDFLLSGAGTIGRIARVPKGIEQGVFNQALIRLRINESMTDSEFFLQFIRSDFMQKNLTETNPGSAIQNLVPMSELKNWTVRIPVVNEQRKIGSLLKKVDNLITATQDKIGALEQVKETLSKNLFDQSWRFKEYSTPWKENKLKDIVSAYSGGTPSANIRTYYGGHIPFIRSAEIHSSTTALTLTQEGLKNSSAKLVKTGDILYALYGANSGDVDRSKINGAINQAILAMRPSKENDSNFILFQLMRMKNKIVSTYLQGGQGNLSGRIILALNLDMPESTSEQRTIGRSLQLLCELISVNQSKYSQLESLKKSLLQNLFV
ncbi:restriction endonuclease subunit S [Lacticaseibacillus paracasei]|nr:restriction endonuclease subunit S [Lacticaseibacillus paracasei]KRK16133.1 type i restriction-modification system specificity subunit [Lacticaseibacillus casei DSM 20011 = JCM 1134 = ATCC 393]